MIPFRTQRLATSVTNRIRDIHAGLPPRVEAGAPAAPEPLEEGSELDARLAAPKPSTDADPANRGRGRAWWRDQVKIGVRKSPHIETLVEAIRASGDTITSTYDTGADFYLCWGWPQGEQVCRDGAPAERVICIDAHPFALAAGDRSGARIFQLGNWGFLARYPMPSTGDQIPELELPRSKAKKRGPVLVLGHVSSTEQIRGELVDVWYTAGGDAWLLEELKKPGRKFRPHPRMWTEPRPQPSLEEDLKGCSSAVAWNSTAAIHARLLGYPATTVEAHGWGEFGLEFLAALRVSPADVKTGVYWRSIYRPWLQTLGR